MSNDEQSRVPKWVMDWSLILAIVVLLVSFVNYGMSFLYPAPDYNDFCGNEQRHIIDANAAESEATCNEAGGKWTSYDDPQAIAPRKLDSSTTTVTGYCDQNYYCRQEYEAANDIHDRNGLIAMLLIGLFVSVFGFIRKKSDIISTAFSIAGVIVIVSGLIRFWSVADDWAQFVLLGSLLIAFVYLALYRS